MADTETDEEHRKLESQQQFRVFPEQRSKLTDSTDMIFLTLPNYIRVMVSNYQPLQTIFAIDKSKCHTREIKKEEQFSPTVTIVDAATQQTLDCVLLLHGEKPPEVSCRTLFCYIAVQVSYHDPHGSHPYPQYHVKSKPCKQGKLPLIFCFHQPGRACNIQLSVHSIVDSEGVEYMYCSEGCDCIVQIIDRDQHEGIEMRNRHGVVRTKEPPLLRYTGSLATDKYHELEKQFTNLFLSPNFEVIQQLFKRVFSEQNSLDIKVFALCWKALSVAYRKNFHQKSYSRFLRTAWKMASKLECENGLLLQGRVLRHWAHMEYARGNDDNALRYILRAKERFINAAPSNETAFVLHSELRLRRHKLSEQFCPELYASLEEEYELLLENAMSMEDYEEPVVCNFFTMKASYHLRSDLITDKLPPKEYWPSPDHLRKAEKCLDRSRVSLHIMPSQSNFYTARYYCVRCDLHIWKKQYSKAMASLEDAREVYHQMKLQFDVLRRTCMHVDQRLKLLKRLMEYDLNDSVRCILL